MADLTFDSLHNTLLEKALPLRSAASLDSLIARAGETDVVMLGESTHGTDEFYYWRSLITQRLITEKQFSLIMVEADWPECMAINRYIWGQEDSAKNALQSFDRWPTWMWANTRMADLVEWLRWYNQSQSEHCIGFYGMDLYSLFPSIREVGVYVRQAAPERANRIMARYACFDQFAHDEIAYARYTLRVPSGCAQAALENMYEVELLTDLDVTLNGLALLDAKHNARTVRNAERYYRMMVRDDVVAWNIRDRHMFETINRLREFSSGGKCIVWAHNTHIGDYRATDMEEAGYINVGGITRDYYGQENVLLVGFGTYEGEVMAAHAWDGAAEVMPLPPASPTSYEAHFHAVAVEKRWPHFLVHFTEADDYGPLAEWRGHRAVGVVYDPHHDRRGHLVPTSLAQRYDAFIFIDTSHSLQPLYAPSLAGYVPQTWPRGE